MPDGATPQISLHDPEARPIAKGRLETCRVRPQAQVRDNEDGIVLDHDALPGNPVRPTIRSSLAEVCRPTISTSGRVMLPSTALTTASVTSRDLGRELAR